MKKYRIWSVVLIISMILLGWVVYAQRFPFKLGLDLAGGTELIYKADTSQVSSDVGGALDSLKDVIERRVNLFGVGEPVIQIEGAGAFSADNKLIVDLPGITDVNEAIALIGQTPLLEFRLLPLDYGSLASTTEQLYALSSTTGLTGRYLSNAQLQFVNQSAAGPIVSLTFNSEGTALFAQLTKNNTGQILGIFLDKQPISLPRINEEIASGEAQITGGFTPEEARTLVRNLNYGALPVPIELVSTQTIGPSLGASAVNAGVMAGIVGIIVIVAFLILWYRLPGAIASVALLMYVVISLVIFKMIPVTLTAAGLAGFILSIGMAVDANILIFERMKEELRKGDTLTDAIHKGFHRAWLSIRDSNISSIITAVVLFWLGTSAVKGFALTLGIGVLVSMFTAITVSRTFLFALPQKGETKASKFLFGSGFRKTTSLEPKS
ncbi:MAG: protein-export rane protein SecD, preprotein translocase subunit SecD [Candidatus Paceibacter sp.]|jgi:protein-export membrane protein SecD|nr:protein-export rane protein SecD, preprotein translocase subunit SecD [Candidatus Paceibacter sp.]